MIYLFYLLKKNKLEPFRDKAQMLIRQCLIQVVSVSSSQLCDSFFLTCQFKSAYSSLWNAVVM
jgi:hypothetical protein